MGKKKAILDIVKELAEQGFEIKYSIKKVAGNTGIFSLYLIKDDGSKILLYSNAWKDKDSGAIVASSPNGKGKDIINKLLPEIAKLPTK